MFNQHTLVRSTLAAALLSAFTLAQPAHAGLLGGGGSLGGGLGGGLGGSLDGSLSPRGVDFGGQAAGQLSREGNGLPRGDKAVQKAGEATRPAGAVQQSATVTAGEQAMLARERAGAVSDSVAGTAAGGGAASATGHMLDASARGSAQASRTGHRASVDASAQGTVRH